MEFNQGAKAAIERMVEAYGVKTKLALCDALGVTASALSNRQVRDSFPAEYVLKCALDTGASLRWLTYGQGEMFEKATSTTPAVLTIPSQILSERKLFDGKNLLLDKEFIPSNIDKPVIIVDGKNKYIATRKYDEIYDGNWVINIDGNISIKRILRIPGNKISVSDGKDTFSCAINELDFLAKVLVTCTES